MSDCRTCKHNAYLGNGTDWVLCVHPVTLAKQPRPEPGDPKMVDYRTGDVPFSQLHNLRDCPCWVAAEQKAA